MHQEPLNGDLLLRQKGPALHLAVKLSIGIAHIQPGSGIRITTLEEFSLGQPYRVIRSGDVEHEGLLERVLELIEQNAPYQLLTNNCEHNANYILHGYKNSPQLQTFAAASVIGAFLARKQSPIAMLLGGLAVGAAGVCLYNANREYAA